MHNTIRQTLAQLEHEQKCKILFAAESGSRAWGFESPDSDYDIRAIYVKPQQWYFDIHEPAHDTFEKMLPNDLDISAWELRKTLRLFASCNLALNEWLGSPIIYTMDQDFYAKIKALLPTFFNPIRATHHYLAMAQKSWDTKTPTNEITLKKLFYALRGLFCAKWSIELGTMPPTRFDDLFTSLHLPNDIATLIHTLQEQKQNAVEKALLPIPRTLRFFYENQRAAILKATSEHSFSMPATNALNNLLYTTVLQYSEHYFKH